MVTIGKAIGGGIPCGAYGLSAELADRLEAMPDLDLVDMGGVGGTLAGNPVSMAAMRATLSQVLTDDAWPAMIALADRFGDAVDAVDRRARPAVVGEPARRARRVPVLPPGAAQRRRVGRRAGRPSSRTTCTPTWPTAACC